MRTFKKNNNKTNIFVNAILHIEMVINYLQSVLHYFKTNFRELLFYSLKNCIRNLEAAPFAPKHNPIISNLCISVERMVVSLSKCSPFPR